MQCLRCFQHFFGRRPDAEILNTEPQGISNSWFCTLHTNIKQSIAAKHFREYTATLFLDDAAGDPSA
jgi:hypothetical protein